VAIERATVQIEDGPVTILPKRAPVGNSGPIRGRTLAIFPTPEGYVESDTRMMAALSTIAERRHHGFLGRVEPGGVPAHAILDMTEAEAATVGAALGLSELLFWDGRRARIIAGG
jgi:hypothetical protein